MKGDHFHECSQRIEDRGISELIGIARGLVADGVVNELEADFLIRWLKENEHLTCWPFDVLNKRVRAMLADGVIDAEERQELLELLRDLIGGEPAAGKAVNFASALPLTQPAPDIVFCGQDLLLYRNLRLWPAQGLPGSRGPPGRHTAGQSHHPPGLPGHRFAGQ